MTATTRLVGWGGGAHSLPCIAPALARVSALVIVIIILSWLSRVAPYFLPIHTYVMSCSDHVTCFEKVLVFY